MLPALSSLDDAELADLLGTLGEPAWRGRQLRQATWQPFVSEWADVRQLSPALRDRLIEHVRFSSLELAAETEADQGMTIKVLGRMHDGETIETVAMETPATEMHRRRASVCVSSQVGCAVGCPFCATGQLGLRRNCTAAEIVDQLRLAQTVLHRRGFGRATHVVFMGMGEPLRNEAAVLRAIELMGEGGIAQRRITLSTSGIVPAIDRLASHHLQITLAISVHAATNELRDRLVPVNRAFPLPSLIESARHYASSTGRRVSLEWCLIGGVNDSVEQARGLSAIAQDLGAHINIIPMNHVDGSPWGPPDSAVTRTFLAALRPATVTVRDTRGSESDAACGQLRAHLVTRRPVQADGTLAPARSARA